MKTRTQSFISTSTISERDLSKSNVSYKSIDFNSKNIQSYYVENVSGFYIPRNSIVVNAGNEPAVIKGEPSQVLLPRKSTLLSNAIIETASKLIIVSVTDSINIGRIALTDGWQTAESIFGSALSGVPLWRSPQAELATIRLNASEITGQRATEDKVTEFVLKANLWFATENTDCVIHNMHNFIEYHTQIYGTGSMQKFKTNSKDSLYEEVILSPGNTHDLFCEANGSRFTYPWHQYFAYTDCIWMATELHPVNPV
jgi:hypothetical protein